MQGQLRMPPNAVSAARLQRNNDGFTRLVTSGADILTLHSMLGWALATESLGHGTAPNADYRSCTR